jgi:CRISPR/Cas system-associated exonuclease Cas4 (RecB family)
MAKRDYQNSYPSVTQALGILRKIGLEMWFKFNTAAFCNAESQKGKEIGIQIHEAIQSHIEAKEVAVETKYGEEVTNALKSFMLFKKENPKIKLKRAEMALTSEKYKYNGTLDCIGSIGKEAVILDWKSGKVQKEKTEPDIYDEFLYQVAAYVMAYNEQEKDSIQKAYILCIAKNAIAYNLREMDGQKLQDCFEKVFLPVLSIYNYQKKGI